MTAIADPGMKGTACRIAASGRARPRRVRQAHLRRDREMGPKVVRAADIAGVRADSYKKQLRPLFDHSSARQRAYRQHGDASALCRLRCDDQLNFGCLLNGRYAALSQ